MSGFQHCENHYDPATHRIVPLDAVVLDDLPQATRFRVGEALKAAGLDDLANRVHPQWREAGR